MNQREQSPADVRTEMLSRSVAQFSSMSGFTGIFLGGSLANQTEDEFSDVDLRVVFEAAFLPAALSDRERFPKQWGPFLFHEFVGPQLTVSHYKLAVKLDLFYYADEALVPMSGSAYRRKC